MQLRHLHYISQFTNHRCGQDNVVADTLSRIAKFDSPVIDYDQINDDELHQLKLYTKSLYLKQHQVPSGKSS